MDSLLSLPHSILVNVGPFFLLLGMLIFVHELGHFAVAKLCGVRVEVFSLGFGKKILQLKRGDTVYCISLIPLGGYVKMFGDDPSKEVANDQKRYSFLDKSVSQRIAIVLAGPLMNLIFAVFLFMTIAVVGDDVPGTKLGDITEGSLAYTSGFRSGDQILQINSKPVETWQEVQQLIHASVDQSLNFVVKRNNQNDQVSITATPTVGENENILSVNKKVGRIEGLQLESLAPIVGLSSLQSPAAKAGIQPLDMILKINGVEIKHFRSIEEQLKLALSESKEVQILVQAQGVEKKQEERTVTIESTQSLLESDAVLAALGLESAELYLWRIKEGSPADLAGLRTGDRLITLDQKPMAKWNDVLNEVKGYRASQRGIDLSFLRNDIVQTVTLVPELSKLMNPQGQEEQRYTVGIVSGFSYSPPEMVLQRTTAPLAVVREGIVKTGEWTGMIVMGLVKLVQGDVSPKNIGGVITIGRFASHSFEAGLSAFLKMMSIISINLFLINLLPVPVLDGGHLLFFSIEALRGAPLSMRKMEVAQQVGLFLLMGLMAYAFFNDINNLFLSGW